MNPRSIILIAIAAVLTVLVILRYTVWGDNGHSAAIQPAPPPEANITIRAESGEFLPPFPAFSAISERPVFRPDRRPEPDAVVEGPAQPAGAAPQTAPEFVVVGTVTGPDGGVATIRSGNETLRAYVGDTVEGWRIDTISGSGIEVSQNGDRFRLSIGEPE